MTYISKHLSILSAGLLCALPLLNAQSTAEPFAGVERDDSRTATAIVPPIDTSVSPGNDQGTARPAAASKPLCSLSGVTQNPEGQPLAQVQVTVHSVADTSDRTVTSAADGSFCVANLRAGRYELTGKAEGFATTSATKVEVSDQQSATV